VIVGLRLRPFAALLAVATLAPGAALAQGETGEPSVSVPEGQVLTFYGLRKLEHDMSVSDEQKLDEWRAYITRTEDNLKYAREAVQRWKRAARLRVIESVQAADHDGKLPPRDKMVKWQQVLDLYPKSPEARIAQKRIAFWRDIETKLLVEAAEEVERQRGSKVARIEAWDKVVEWVGKGSEARAAQKRIDALQNQLYEEARSLDKIARVDAETKLASWRDVLRGRPSAAQKKQAEQRIAELEKR
jgi:hypothetical protein